MAKKTIFTDSFGNLYFLKRFIIFILGLISYRRFNGFNKLKISGTEHLVDLPERNVLFVSNHQTYFADVAAMYHAFCAVNNGYHNTIKNPVYLLNPKVDFYYVAAEETMNKGILARIFKLAGAVTVKRTWRAEGKNVNRMVDMSEVENIIKALDNGWVITFPQGTTSAFAQGRKGTAKLVKQQRPIVIPIKINGFRRAFDKKGLKIKVTGVEPTMEFKPALDIDYENESAQEILQKIMEAIEQTPEHNILHEYDEELKRKQEENHGEGH
ncbi:1-acyl-sn-glycerol-3-phosphate acyltransferase [Riemerella anatipestifer]|uniref:lysophospholipid acyltransferase family protein n=1 Tax=Riemerella anatipestifer TaxID=34085 RepID=UPI0012ADBF11|nr:lysophospholipid acyltransferase family protein [Riemerella anatipestifer]MDY3520840.1 lysophospholipid acyltransferase family protein [Riemerella anatipestifer]MDY3533081.1 lysophospholipid acyltransferase family protein [Riemerella anatipestifer]MDY3535554.1 lysophospholipid acyltransferase family protein [Riemerella anatipestifer]USL95373.1 1-acyl-sn-glycerol-3-phosphate acyltransferase [Riemerella anatipestifer]